MMNTFKRWHFPAVLILTGIIYLGNSQGRAYDANSGNTGAPGETATCQNCHNSSAIEVTMSLMLTDTMGNEVSSYRPDSTYRLTVQIERKKGVPVAYGFQMVCIDDQNLADAGSWIKPADNVRIASSNRTMHTYAEHKGLSASNVFVTDWVAPKAGSGDVTFYTAGVGADLSGSDLGDGAASTKLNLSEEATSAITSASESTLQVYPNPVHSYLHCSEPIAGQYALYDLQGRRLLQGNFNNNIDLQPLQAGVYWIQITGENKSTITQKILKL